MKFSEKNLNTISTAVDNFINCFQLFDYDYQEENDYNVAYLMELLETYLEEEEIADLITIQDDLFLSYPIEIDYKRLEQFNESFKNGTLDKDKVIPVYKELSILFYNVLEGVKEGTVTKIGDKEDLKEYYKEILFCSLPNGYQVLEFLEDNYPWITYEIDADKMFKDDFDYNVTLGYENYYVVEQ